MVKPERRTRTDLAVAAAIVAVIVVVAGVVWWTSDSRATSSRPAATASKSIPPAREVPTALKELWTAASAATTVPVLASGTVVTGNGQAVEGRDPANGQIRWSYQRDLELCGVTWIYQYAVAVYPDSRGCGQVSTVDSSTGKRGPARTGYADDHIELSSDGTIVLAAGSTRIETWRSDMVRVIGYGEVDARVKPNQTGVGKGCTIKSAAASPDTVALLQACAGENDVRLTLLKPGKDDDEPELRDIPQVGVSPDAGARVLAVSGTDSAVYLPAPHPHVAVFDDTGTQKSSTDLAGPPSAGTTSNSTVSRAGGLITWWTGDSVLAFNADTLTHKFTIESTGPTVPLGPATLMADKLLVPITSGLGVYDAGTGVIERVIPIARTSMDSGVAVVVPAVIGSTVLEQRGNTLVALG